MASFSENAWDAVNGARCFQIVLTPTCVDKSQESPFSVPHTISISLEMFRFPKGAASVALAA
jgi:hypothetical protein